MELLIMVCVIMVVFMVDGQTAVNCGDSITGSMGYYGDDYYTLNITNDESVEISDDACGQFTTLITVYDSNEAVLGSADCDLTIDSISPGIYYIGIGASSGPGQQYELNVICDVVPIIECGEAMVGSIAPREIDRYKFVPTADYMQLQIEACNPGTNYDTYLYFYDANLGVIEKCDDCNNHNTHCGAHGDLSVLGRDLSIGNTFYVGIGGFLTSSGNYNVTLVCSDELDPAPVGSISCGQTVTGSIVVFGEDYYTLSLTQNYSSVVVESCNPGTNIITDLYFYSTPYRDIIDSCNHCNDHGPDCGTSYDLTINNIASGNYEVGISGILMEAGNYEVTLFCYP